MGFFNFDKPGPGINPDAPKKKGIFLYFELLKRNFGLMLKTNILYVLSSLPMVLVCLFGGMYFSIWLSNIFTIVDPVRKTQLAFFLAFLFMVFIGSGPASASLAYFYRSILREEHVFVFSDFWGNIKKNFRQGIVVGIINPIINLATIFCTLFYGLQYILTGQLIWFLAMLIVGIFCLILAMSGFYIYQLMITFENSIPELYKNAFILALIKAPQNLSLMLIIAVISYIVFFMLTPVASIALVFLGLVAVLRLAVDLYTAKVIEKNILKNK